MKLVIGGYVQGKLNYVLQKHDLDESLVFDGRLPNSGEALEKVVIINHFHNWVRASLLKGENPEEMIMQFLENCPECIVISDEIGNGIVPVDAFEREYREQTGRLLIEIAAKAEEVERVICGIGQKIK